MRYFLTFIIAGNFYLFACRQDPTAAVVQKPSPSAQPAPTTSANNFIKRPLDRTHSVLDQARKQRDENAF
jgi:hypothetical protein